MTSNTISITPIAQSTTVGQIRDIFRTYFIQNVHLQGNTAYVQFTDAGDLQNLQMVFNDLTIPQLNNAKIDVAENFDWNKIINQVEKQNKKSSNNSSDKHQDISAAEIKNLIVVKYCDENILNQMSEKELKAIFKQFSSVNRILKQNNQVIIQILDLDEIQLLEARFVNLHVPELGAYSKIESAEENHVDVQKFTSDWSKMSESKLPKSPQHQDLKPHQVLHAEIIPPFDKKTSMQVNYMQEHGRFGYGEQLQAKQPIHEASTYQQLGYPSEQKITSDNKLGYEAYENQQKKLQQQQQLLRKFQQERLKKLQLQQSQRKMKQLQEQRRREQTERLERQQRDRQRREEQLREQERREHEQEQRKRKQREQEERFRHQQEEKERLRLKRQTQLAQLQKETPVIPTQSQQAQQQVNFIKQAGETIEEQLGYAVNQAKSESANLVNAGLQLLKTAEQKVEEKLGYEIEQGTKLVQQTKHQIGYKPQQNAKSLLKQQQKYGYKQKSEQKWNIKPEEVPRPISGTKRQISRTLVTVTLAIWVLFLLFQ